MDLICRVYGQRPSIIAGIGDPYVAYCFDEAIALRGLLIRAKDGGGTVEQNLKFGPGGLTGGFSGVVGKC